MLLPFLRSFQPPDPKTNDAIPNIPLALSVPLAFFLGSACSLPKYTTVNSEQPPDYYLGESPEVSVVNAEGATRRTGYCHSGASDTESKQWALHHREPTR